MEFLYIVLGTAVWVLVDAKTIGVKKGQIKGLFNMSPLGWFGACVLFWIIAFPAYLAKRSHYKEVIAASSDAPPQQKAIKPDSHEAKTPAEQAKSREASQFIKLFFVIIFAIVIGYFTLKGLIGGIETTQELAEIPPCNSEEFNFSVSHILEDEMGLTVYEIKGTDNPLSLPHERYVNEDTGEMFSNCIATTKTNVGRVMFDVLLSQADPSSMIYIEVKEIPYKFPKGH